MVYWSLAISEEVMYICYRYHINRIRFLEYMDFLEYMYKISCVKSVTSSLNYSLY